MATPAKTLNIPNDPVQTIRRFNRFYTRRIGVLHEHLLESQFSLTEVRVLYELAHRENVTASELRQDLGLDRGYLSRMLRAFEKKGYLKMVRAAGDLRRVLLSLTARGRRVFARLEQRSNKEIGAMLAKLSSVQQKSLLSATREIERVLAPPTVTAAPYTLRSHRPGDMGWVVHRHGILYSQEYGYDERFEALVAEIVSEFVQHFDPKRDSCWVAEKDGEIVGSIFLVKKSKTVAKLRLLLVEPSARGMGIGKRLIAECVRFAQQAGYKKIVLWTQSELHAARHLYEQAGFTLAGEKRHDSWGRKGLVAETWELKL
jgi:DNA-binding MarR family transcriptional regulator/GNAT superfamily N-acetyltransferase